MAGWGERPSRPGQPTAGRQGRRKWLLPGFTAAVLHLAVLAAIVAMANRPASPGDAPPAEAVALIFQPPATTASIDAARPDQTTAPPTPLPPEQATQEDALRPSGPEEPAPPPTQREDPPAQPAQHEEPPRPPTTDEPMPPPQPATEAPSPAPQPPQEEAAPARPPPIEKTQPKPPARPTTPKPVPRPPVVRARPTPAPTGAGQPGEAAKSASPANAMQAAATANLLGNYENRLAEHVKAYQRYPAIARSRREEGLVVVHVTIRRDGRIAGVSVAHGSGSELLDSEALATLKRADPLPAMPTGLPGETIDLAFPLRFQLE